MHFDVVSIGEPMVEFNALPAEPSRYLRGFGGDTMNALIAASRHGASTCYVSRVGDDEFGRSILDLLSAERIDTRGVQVDASAPTGCYFITHGPTGHEFSYRRAGSAASLMTPESTRLELLDSTRFLHASGISQAISPSACDTVLAAVDRARNSGTKFCYDSNLRLTLWPLHRARAIIEATAAQADYFLPSMEDARVLSGLDDPDAVFDWAIASGARHVALKLGRDGVLAGDARDRWRISGLAVRAVDATGAGDCFAGALLARLSAGDDFRSACRYANAAAALTCEGYGAVAPIPTPQAVAARLHQAAGPQH